MSAFLSMTGISKRFGGVSALEGAALNIDRGSVHALMGANGAGKSTLMNILGGLVTRDDGKITVADEPVAIAGARAARELGISFVAQELNMLPSMTVAENVLIDGLPRRGALIDRASMNERVAALLKRLGCSFSPNEPVEALSMGDRQMVEIARALASDPKIVIFDEPTSSLSERERHHLFHVIADLKAGGTAIIYITHFLDEIFTVCDQVTVMRNGTTVASGAIGTFSPADIIALMLGDVHQQDRLREHDVPLGEAVLSARDLSRDTSLRDISFSLRSGEIVGLWGLLGSGRTETLRALVGLDPIDSGEIRYRQAGAALLPIEPTALHAHVGFVTEDRRGEGLLLSQSIARNIAFPNLGRLLSRLGLVDRKRERRFAEDLANRLNIKCRSVSQPVRALSGGNQQKVVFARWLGTRPEIFLLDEPTRGLDVGAKTDILRLTVELAERGAAVLIVSSELEELMRVCDRYLIIQRGSILGELPGTASKDALMESLSSFAKVRKQAA